jgi:hypothetical protein
MGWLRREKDCIGLVVAWAILVQAVILSFTSGLHAATLAAQPGQAVVICTARGAVIARQLPGQSHQKTDCQCCSMACRSACGGSCGGILPIALRVPLPASVQVPADRPNFEVPAVKSAEVFSGPPRAPPTS